MIAHHSSYARIYKQHWIAAMIVFCWVFAYGMQLPTFFEVWGLCLLWPRFCRSFTHFDFYATISGAFGYDKNLGTCSILKDENGRSSKTALFVIAFVIPCIIIIGCYARIFWVVHEWVNWWTNRSNFSWMPCLIYNKQVRAANETTCEQTKCHSK